MVQLQQCYTLGALSLPPGAVWSQNVASRFLGDCKREIWGKGYILHHDDGPFCWMEPNMEWLSLGTAENGHQSCGPEQRGFIIVCGSSFCYSGSNEKSNGIAETATKSRNKCLRPHDRWKCFWSHWVFFLSCLSIIASTSGGGRITFLQDIKDKSTCMCCNELFD